MKIWIGVVAAAFTLCSSWKECHSVPLQEEASDLTNLKDVNTDERAEDKQDGVDRYAESEETIKEDEDDEYGKISNNADEDHDYMVSLQDSSYRRKPYRHCICVRRSSRRRWGGWRPLPRPY